MRLATIDLGTNTVRLLVAEVEACGRWRLVHQEQRVTRVGEGLWPAGLLRDGPMTRTAEAVVTYVARARAHGAAHVRIVATSAVREAANGGGFAQALAARTGVPVDVVSGADEARLTVRGVLEGLGRPPGTLLVFDIGGGSTEYIRARDGTIEASVSLRLGVVPLAEAFPFPRAVPADAWAALEREVAGRLAAELPRAITEGSVDRLVGTAGTVTALAALDLGLTAYDAARVQGHRLTRAGVDAQLRRLAALTLAERARLPSLEPGRADVLLAGIAIVRATMAALAVDALTVSDAGLREGMMDDAVARLAGGAI